MTAKSMELQHTIRIIRKLDAGIANIEAEVETIMNEIRAFITNVPDIGYRMGTMALEEPGDLSRFDSPDSVLHMLHRVLKRAGLPKVRFHDLRHTFATLALQNGVDVKTVSGMLGHFSAGFTLDTYARITSAAQRQAAQTMGSVLYETFQP